MTNSGDMLLQSTNDGGEIAIIDSFFVMTDGFKTATYITLFGGNIEDNGTESTKLKSWWGNQLSENEPDKKIISRTMAIIKGFPATPANLRKVEKAAADDLAWFKSQGICDTIIIVGSIPSKNRLELKIEMLKDGNKLDNFKFIENWGGMINEENVFIPPNQPVTTEFENMVTEDGFTFMTSDLKYMSSRIIKGV
jgi:phage gp46-like protein